MNIFKVFVHLQDCVLDKKNNPDVFTNANWNVLKEEICAHRMKMTKPERLKDLYSSCADSFVLSEGTRRTLSLRPSPSVWISDYSTSFILTILLLTIIDFSLQCLMSGHVLQQHDHETLTTGTECAASCYTFYSYLAHCYWFCFYSTQTEAE